MVYKLYSIDSTALLQKPETGMGYQIVEATTYSSSQVKRYVIYNSELAVDLDSEFKSFKGRIIKEGFSSIVIRSDKINFVTNSLRVLNKTDVPEIKALGFSETKKANTKRHSGGKGAKDGPKENANGTEVFVRLSAYEDDKRIDFVNKKLKPGSYTTTEQDYKDCVSTSDDPVDRYALPNDETIKWTFYVKPKTNDALQRGIVQPAFDHEGGGIEVYFENGTSNDTYYQKKPYGQ